MISFLDSDTTFLAERVGVGPHAIAFKTAASLLNPLMLPGLIHIISRAQMPHSSVDVINASMKFEHKVPAIFGTGYDSFQD